ncbi:N-acetylmuramoyl-L-alanine amidase [Streptomyces sp. NPDC057638]|uniref:peptidoglycan recognition protein family protein n=1 Tax=Streptomyces sp. NPDC057638 TaxID=3346190 RepID=UPI00367C0C33
MAQPMSANSFLNALRAEGLTVVEVGSWRTHNRNHIGPWGPVNGVMIHHTVTNGTNNTVALCRDGRPDLPGPLCHGVITKDGRVHLVGFGRANHAGKGDGDVLQAVIAERALPPKNRDDTDGNPHFYGFECENLGNGKDPWPEAQLEAIERTAAAVCRVHGWSSRSVIGHLEWRMDKSDPRGFTMDAMRTRVQARLNSESPTPPQPPGETMAISKVTEQNPIDVEIPTGTWTGLAFRDAVIHSGPRTLVGPTYVQLTLAPDTAPDLLITGRFYLTDTDGSGESGYGDIGPFPAAGGLQFLHNHNVPSGKHLRFKVLVTGAPATSLTITHRTATGDFAS